MAATSARFPLPQSFQPSQDQPPTLLQQQTQPKSFRLSVKAFLSLPYRICHPPTHTVGSVRSFSVTPIYDVQLDDVLSRKHLPPLGLKDFEEWLLYVENVPENLYFILWLRDYTQRYNRWTHQSKPTRDAAGEYRVAWPTQSSSQLALFYARAKQTFFTINGDFELNLPSDILAPFHNTGSDSIHPDPAVFAEVAAEVRKMLEESLARFVLAAYTNVGTGRAVCGLTGGIVISLLGSVAPLAYNFASHQSPWLRLLAMPGLWLGLTILLASFNGVCLMIWAGGDIRQLRKFELSRPAISRPSKPVPMNSHLQPVSLPARAVSVSRPPQPPPRLFIPPPPIPPVQVTDASPLSRSASITDSLSSGYLPSIMSSADSESAGHNIYISSAYYDEDPVEGPATGHDTPITPAATFTFPSSQNAYVKKGHNHSNSTNMGVSSSSSMSFTPTAAFIRPFVYDDVEDDDKLVEDVLPRCLERNPPISPDSIPFDFDVLPPRRHLPVSPERSSAPLPLSRPKPETISKTDVHTINIRRSLRDRSSSREPFSSFTEFFAYLQDRCSFRKWRVGSLEDGEFPADPEKAESTAIPSAASRMAAEAKRRVRAAQFKAVKAVPSFASPLTRILSPVIRRAQWEIVCRSGILSLLLCWLFLGCLLAAPVGGS